jgi:hypothetical protein
VVVVVVAAVIQRFGNNVLKRLQSEGVGWSNVVKRSIACAIQQIKPWRKIKENQKYEACGTSGRE